MVKAIFFDRDGVVNKDFGYVFKIEDFIFLEGFFQIFTYLKKKGYLLLLVTNQSGIAAGYYTQEDFDKLTFFMQSYLKSHLQVCFDRIYFCPHAPDSNCPCRKPKPGLIYQALDDFNINLEESFLIGDKLRDIQAGNEAGVKYKILLGKEDVSHISNAYNVSKLIEIPKLVDALTSKEKK